MGNGIAHVIAQNGYKTNLVDISQEALDKGLLTIAKNLDRMVAKELITENDKKSTLGNITPFTKLADGVKKVDSRSHQKSGQGYWNALYESRTHYAIGRDNKGL